MANDIKKSIKQEFLEARVDRKAVSLALLGDDSDDIAYWLSRTPEERLRHAEMLRRMNYGHRATERLSRVLEIVERPWG